MNLDTGIVRIEIEGHRFDVPLRHMYSHALATYGRWPTPKEEVTKVGALNLSVLLPDMRPYYTQDDARWKVRGHGDKVEVSIAKYNGPQSGWENGNAINRAAIEKFIAEGRFYKKAPNIYGLAHYSEKTGDVYFAEDRELDIKCDPDEAPKGLDFWSPSCKAQSNYLPGLVLEYYYALKYLPQWKEIDDGLKAMFDKFAQASQTASANQ